MRRVLAVAIATILVFGTVGILTVAQGPVSTYDVAEDDVILEDVEGIDDQVLNDVDEETSVIGKEQVRVIKPKGIKDGTYEVKNEESNGKVLVIVDPIHVTE